MITLRKSAFFTVPLLVAALGYFVDIYDLLLFSIIRVPSLKNLGLPDAQVTTVGEHILGIQNDRLAHRWFVLGNAGR